MRETKLLNHSESHRDRHYVSGDEVAKSDGILKFSKVVRPTGE